MLFTEFNEKDNLFKKVYLKNLINRFTNASLGIEGEHNPLDDAKQALNIFYQTESLRYALLMNEENNRNPMKQCMELKELIKLITGGEFDNYRTTYAEVYGSKISRTKPQNIHQELLNMFYDYNNFIPYTNEVDEVFLKEAQNHIRLLHIHPFQDGNGRISRIILIRNLLFQNRVPCVITKELKSEYCSYIENNDVIGLAKMLQKQSKKELQIMLCIYDDLNSKGLIKENLMSDIQQEEYEKIIGKITLKESCKKKTLRNANNILNLFKHGILNNNEKLTITKMFRHKIINDNESKDYAIYCEDSNLIAIKIDNDERLFTVKQEGNEIIFMIDDKKVFLPEFEYELNNNETKEKELIKTF